MFIFKSLPSSHLGIDFSSWIPLNLISDIDPKCYLRMLVSKYKKIIHAETQDREGQILCFSKQLLRMGVVKIEDDRDGDIVQAQENQDPVGEEQIVIYSGFTLCFVIFLINLCCAFGVFVLSRLKRDTGYYRSDASQLIKAHTHKLSILNVSAGLIATILAYWLTYKVAVYEDVENICFRISELSYMLIFTVCFTIGVCCLRYMAYGLANSDTYQVLGQEVPGGRNQNTSDIKGGFNSSKSPVFVGVITTYFMLAFIFFISSTVILLGYVPDRILFYLVDVHICIPNEIMDFWNKAIFIFTVIVGPYFSCVIAGKLLHTASNSDFHGILLTTPFTTTTAGTYCSGWLILLWIMYRWLHYYALQIVFVWEVFACLDSIWVCLISLLAAGKRR